MMKCPACGARYSASERLCPTDGAVLEHEQSIEEQLIGKTLDGKYRLESFISRGGMGAVFRGTHVMLNRPVAVKMINADLVTSPEIVRRFQREARAATHLNHPNIVDVYDLGQTAEGTLYIVMELVSGESLKEEIRAKGALAPARIVHVLAQVCDGLGAAHRANIVHRDLKPHNVMLTRDRSGAELAKIVDFGIAKTFEVDSHTQLTADGSTLGTPHYMSPEQATGREIDGRSDIYSLGIILYEMLTGEVPFDDQSLPAVLIKHMSEPPAPPSQRRPDLQIPPALEAIALRCLAKDPAARYATADEMGAALRAALVPGAGDATVPMSAAAGPASSAAVTAPMAGAVTLPLGAGAPTVPMTAAPTAAATPGTGATSPVRPATHPTAPAMPPPLPPPASSSSAAPAPGPSMPAATTRSSRGPAALVAAFLLLLAVAAGVGYWTWSRANQPIVEETITAEGEPPAASPASNTPPSAETPATPQAQGAPATPGDARAPETAAPAPAAPAATAPATAASGNPGAAAETSTERTPPAVNPRAAVPPAPPAPSSAAASSRPATPTAAPPAAAVTSKPATSGATSSTATPVSGTSQGGAQTQAKPAAGASAPAAAPSQPAAAVPENPSISFQCRGPAEICTPLRAELQSSLDRAGLSLRRAGADINITAEVEQTDESTQRSFGTTLNVRTYSVQMEAESPRFDNEEIAMPNTPPVTADPRVGTERFTEYARRLSPEVIERVRAFWSKRRP